MIQIEIDTTIHKQIPLGLTLQQLHDGTDSSQGQTGRLTAKSNQHDCPLLQQFR